MSERRSGSDVFGRGTTIARVRMRIHDPGPKTQKWVALSNAFVSLNDLIDERDDLVWSV